MNLIKSIIDIVESKMDYFLAFKKIADLKGEFNDGVNKKQMGQFKTEKWLQAEIAATLFNNYEKDIKIIPEFTKKKWDLYIEWKKSKKILIELKCFPTSAQNPNGDFKPIKKDIEKLAMYESNIHHKLYILILPFEGKYKDKIEKNLKSEIKTLQWKLKQKILESVEQSKQGVTFLWISISPKK